jgi:hypothetical protein
MSELLKKGTIYDPKISKNPQYVNMSELLKKGTTYDPKRYASNSQYVNMSELLKKGTTSDYTRLQLPGQRPGQRPGQSQNTVGLYSHFAKEHKPSIVAQIKNKLSAQGLAPPPKSLPIPDKLQLPTFKSIVEQTRPSLPKLPVNVKEIAGTWQSLGKSTTQRSSQGTTKRPNQSFKRQKI